MRIVYSTTLILFHQIRNQVNYWIRPGRCIVPKAVARETVVPAFPVAVILKVGDVNE